MTFVTAGLAIAGLAAVSIPILIHLLWRQRRKPIEWAAMRFLLEAWKRHRRRLRLEQMLLLATRCLIVAVLGAALARPILEATGVMDLGGSRTVYLVIDNGLASAAQIEGDQTVLDRQIARATAIVDELRPGDFVGLITAARPARGLVVPPSSDHGGIIDELSGMRPSEAATDLGGALTTLRTALDTDETVDNTLVYLLSSFRAGAAPLDRPLPEILAGLPAGVTLIAAAPDPDPIPNVQVVGVDPVRSVVIGGDEGSGQITVRLARGGGPLDRDVTRVRLAGADGGPPRVDDKIVQWEPGQSEAHVEFQVDLGTTGSAEVPIVASIDEDALAADNRRLAVVESRKAVRVLLVDRRSFGLESSVDRLSPGQWMRRALEPIDDSPLQIVETEPVALDPVDLRGTDVALVPRPDLLTDAGWQHLRTFVDRGGLLVISPPQESRVHQWTEHLADDLGLPWALDREIREHAGGLALADEQPASGMLRMISSEIDTLSRPVLIYRVLALDEQRSRASTALRLADGTPLLAYGNPVRESVDGGEEGTGRGLVVYLAVAPDLAWTNLPTKPLMVPLFHEIVKQGLSEIRRATSAIVAETAAPALPAAAHTLIGPGQRRTTVDRERGLAEPLDRAGFWTVEDAAGLPLGTLAVNVDDRAARTDLQAEPAVRAWLEGAGPWTVVGDDELASAIETARAGSPLARVLLVALLVLVVLETLMARWFSYARSRGRETGRVDESARLAVGGGGGVR